MVSSSNTLDTSSDDVDTIDLKNKINELPAGVKNYFLATVEYIPEQYIVTPAYVKLKSMKFEKLPKPRVVVCGPKGVGKSLSLLTLAVERTIDKDKVLYFSPFSLDASSVIIEDYLKKCGYTCRFDEVCTEIVKQRTRVTLLLDFGKGDCTGDNEPLINRFKMIIRGNYDHIKVIVALSSGQGGIFNKDEFLRSLVSSGKSVSFKNFSDKEASAFCNILGLKGKFPVLSKLTNNNPGLIYFLMTYSLKLDWKEHVKAEAKLRIYQIITGTFEGLIQMEKNKFVKEACKLTPHFLKCAANGDGVSKKYKESFLISYVYLEGICYTDDDTVYDTSTIEERCDTDEESHYTGEDTVEESGNEYFHVHLTFPGSEQMILDKVRDCMNKGTTSEEYKILQLLGYKFQLEFFKVLNQVLK